MYETNSPLLDSSLAAGTIIFWTNDSAHLNSLGLIVSNQAVQLQMWYWQPAQRKPATLITEILENWEETNPRKTHPTMTLQLKTKARLFDLHCSVGLTDWDMDKELKLATTTDQFYHGDCVLLFSVILFPFISKQHEQPKCERISDDRWQTEWSVRGPEAFCQSLQKKRWIHLVR